MATLRRMGDQPGTALLVMHMQNGVITPLPNPSDVVERVVAAIGAARAHRIPVIYVRMVFRSGCPEMQASGRSNPFFLAFEEGRPGAEIHELARPQSGDLVVNGSRASAFKGTDLEILLRTSHVNQLVLTGVGTSGVVLSTLIEAADLDYRVTVLSDSSADPDAEVHRVLCEKVFPMRATVSEVDAWIANLT